MREELISFLLRIPLLRDVRIEWLAECVELIAEREFAAGEVIARQGELPAGLYILESGEADIVRRDPQTGLHFNLERLLPLDLFGLESVISSVPFDAALYATTPANVYLFPADALRRLCDSEPAAQRAVSFLLAARTRELRSRSVETQNLPLARARVDPAVLRIFDEATILRYQAVPIHRDGAQLIVAAVDPRLTVIDDLSRLHRSYSIHPLAVRREEFEQFFRTVVAPVLAQNGGRAGREDEDRWFRVVRRVPYTVSFQRSAAQLAAEEERQKNVPGEQVVATLDKILSEAHDLDASDIHIEPQETELHVRYRVDGRLKRRPETLPLRFALPLVSRVKVLSRMDIADRMRPQDGRLAVSIEGRERYLRVSTIPTHFGEKMVLRVLDPRSIFIEMDRLFLVDAVRDAVRVMSGQPQGMVIVAGPTGSGKTTTIYSLIHQRCADEVNIVTIEDPIEYTIEGTAQVQVNEAQEVTFAGAIRSFLRQDPDIMLVGETRDSLTARASIEAALTGHLVFTSLHANDALGCILRLKEMGIEPFMVAHTLHGVISQRLVRRICPKCRQPQPYDRALLAPLGVLPDDQRDTMVPLFRGRGCSECNFLGYKGRLGVYEVLRVSDELRPLIAAGRDLSELRPFCVDRGLLWPLRDYAYYLLTAGFTTPEEVLRMLFTDEGGE